MSFPTFSLRAHSAHSKASCTQWQWRGGVEGAPQLTYKPVQVTDQALVHPHAEPRSQPSGSGGLSHHAQWGIQMGITRGILIIMELWPNTNYLKGNLWSIGTKHTRNTPQWPNVISELSTTQRRQAQQHSISFPYLLKYNWGINSIHKILEMWLSDRCIHCVIMITIEEFTPPSSHNFNFLFLVRICRWYSLSNSGI